MAWLVLWVWTGGAAVMAALGPPPRWLAGEFVTGQGRDLPPGACWALWTAQCALWPAAVCWLVRRALYPR